MSHNDYPVFFDPTQRRGVWMTRLLLSLGACLLALVTVFWASVLSVPVAARVRLHRPTFLPDNPKRTGNTDRAPLHPPAHGAALRVPSARRAAGHGTSVVGGFYVDWDPASLESLRAHATALTHLFPGWLHLDDSGGGLVIRDQDPSDTAARQLARQHHLAVLPLVNNYSDQVRDFDETRLHQLLTDPQRRQAVIAALLGYVTREKWQGVMLDLETDRDDDRAALAGFTTALTEQFHRHGLVVASCTQVGDPEETAALAAPCDFIVPMLYDLHWASGSPGPIAPGAWVRQQLDQLLTAVPAEKVVLALGNYAYDWKKNTPGARTLTYGEAMVTAKESQSEGAGDTDGRLRWDAASQNPTFTYEEDGVPHEVWLMDAVTAWNAQRYAQSKGVQGRALWYVGSEDPTLWSFFGRHGSFTNSQALAQIRYGFGIEFEGEGEVLDVAALPTPGARRLTRSPEGYLIDERIQSYPTACVLRRSGRMPKTIALTFDDGPDPRWTPQVLAALKQAGVPATFFVTGVATEQYPELVQQAWRAGHEIGNHSFYHPNLAEVSPGRATLELDATQRAIQAAIGRSTTLFRPPYGVDSQPETAAEVAPIALAQKLGYVTVAEGLDPRDWEGHPQAEKLVARVLAEAEAGHGSIVLLHDSGGDRSATIAAIPALVAQLKAHGYRFVTVSQLVARSGQSRDSFFPAITGRQRIVVALNKVTFALATGLGRFLAGVFLASLGIGALRLAVTGLLALAQARQPAPSAVPPGRVSVVIAAYNEEKVIARTLQALLASELPLREVIVVDDGSTDNTAAIVEAIAAEQPVVRLVRQANAGKAAALNRGIAQASGDLLVHLDADTLFVPSTIRHLIAPFSDPSVGAVAGNIQVGNRGNLWTRLQALEYTTSQNFDRRAFALLNAIPVVPGCVGAWRREAVLAAGGYQSDTLAEDADLTWRVRKAGWRIVTQNAAYAFTEAPERPRELLKQRFRWTFGTLQVLWKHRDVLGRPQYGWFGMTVAPLLWLFSYGLPALAPAADLGILFAAISGQLPAVAFYFLAFVAVEAVIALLAFSLDNADRSRRRDLYLLPVQRIVWRYLLLLVLWRALWAAGKGLRAGWGKLDRKGTAQTSAPVA